MNGEDLSGAIVTPLELTVSGPPTHPVLVARGEIDVATSPQLRTQLTNLIARGATH